MYEQDRGEPFWWGMFSLGGTVAALLIPVHVFFDGLAVPLGLLPAETLGYERMKGLLENPIMKVYLFLLVVLPLYHAAHRIRFSLYELGIRALWIRVEVLCYGGALLGTAVAVYILWAIL